MYKWQNATFANCDKAEVDSFKTVGNLKVIVEKRILLL